MDRIREELAEVLTVHLDGFGDVRLPNPFAPGDYFPGDYFTVDLNAAAAKGFKICDADDEDIGWLESYVEKVFEAAGIDLKEDLVKLRDVGCTFGGVPVLNVVSPKDGTERGIIRERPQVPRIVMVMAELRRPQHIVCMEAAWQSHKTARCCLCKTCGWP